MLDDKIWKLSKWSKLIEKINIWLKKSQYWKQNIVSLLWIFNCKLFIKIIFKFLKIILSCHFYNFLMEISNHRLLDFNNIIKKKKRKLNKNNGKNKKETKINNTIWFSTNFFLIILIEIIFQLSNCILILASIEILQ